MPAPWQYLFYKTAVMTHKKEKKFLKLPHLDGGKELLIEFIKDNLRYPREALEKGIEGDVIVRFKVTGKGEVIQPEVYKGLGYGCDEEAIRLVQMLRYQSVKNRGVRVTTNNKIKIPFRLKTKQKKQKITMTYKAATADKETSGDKQASTQKGRKPQAPEKPEKDKKKPAVYTYTIKY